VQIVKEGLRNNFKKLSERKEKESRKDRLNRISLKDT